MRVRCPSVSFEPRNDTIQPIMRSQTLSVMKKESKLIHKESKLIHEEIHTSNRKQHTLK